MTETRKTSKGIMFEQEVLELVDRLAGSTQRDRSFIVNQIIRDYFLGRLPAGMAVASAVDRMPPPPVGAIKY